MSCLSFDDANGGETCQLQLLFGPDESDADDDDANSPICVATPIPQVHLVESHGYHDEVVRLTASNQQEHLITAHLPSIHMSGCGASVELMQPNHTTNITGTGGVVWGCAPALCTVLSGRASSAHYLGAFDFSHQVVLELGAGTGALGLWIATKWPTATVILTDLPETMHLLRSNIQVNQLESRCIAAELTFGDTIPSFLATLQQKGVLGLEGGIHAIVASDCQFSLCAEFLWQPFAATLASAKPLTQIWISLQERYGTQGERLAPFLNALGDLAQRKVVQPGAGARSNGEYNDFVELFHPVLAKGSRYYNATHPNRCLYLSL
jgi:Lysine methyltransferase